MTIIYLIDGDEVHADDSDPNRVTVAQVGVCVYDEGMKSSTTYPWHQIKKVSRAQ